MTAAVQVLPTAHVVRILPVPRLEPPTDDELRAAGVDTPALTAPALPLALPYDEPRPRPIATRAVRADRPPTVIQLPPADVAVGEAAAGAALATAPAVAESSQARATALRFLSLLLEVAEGFRPVAQLRSICRGDRFEEICERITGRRPNSPTRAYHAAGAAALINGRTPVPGRSGSAAIPKAGRSPADRVSVRRVHVCDVSSTVAEVTIILARNTTTWAVAIRLELREQKWLCSHLEII